MSTVRTLALLVMFSLACGKKDSSPEPAPTPAPAPDAAAAPRPADAAPAPPPADAAATPSTVDAAPAGQAADAGAKTAGNQGPPRDLKVLPRSWSRDKVDDWMEKNVERGLGVKCEHCHEKDDYAAAHEKKTLARDMMRMTAELDRTYFKGKGRITCFTCHLGKEKPPDSK